MSHEPSLDALLQQVGDNHLLYAVMSSPLNKGLDQPSKVIFRPLLFKGQAGFQVSRYFQQQVFHKNLTVAETLECVKEILPQFKQGCFFTREADYQVLMNKAKKMTILKKMPTKNALPMLGQHDRKKTYVLQEGEPVPFLIELGVMTSTGKIAPKKYAKFRQINRFLEVIQDVLPSLKKGKKIQIVDFGCGKAYLTFALYHYLQNIEGYQLQVTGLDLKQEVIDQCQALAIKLGYQNLQFSMGDINHHEPKGKIDMVITLHACDTATDAALEKAIRWDADVILSVPCCQHELYHQIENNELNCLLKHGLLKERFAALVTDAARGQILEIMGYDIKMIEFVDFEHTPKNLLIRALKHSKVRDPMNAVNKYREFKKLLTINPSLEQRFESLLKTYQK